MEKGDGLLMSVTLTYTHTHTHHLLASNPKAWQQREVLTHRTVVVGGAVLQSGVDGALTVVPSRTGIAE